MCIYIYLSLSLSLSISLSFSLVLLYTHTLSLSLSLALSLSISLSLTQMFGLRFQAMQQNASCPMSGLNGNRIASTSRKLCKASLRVTTVSI